MPRNIHSFVYSFLSFCFVSGLSVFERNPSSFQLLGLDFLVTENYQVWFIEANNYPLWPKTFHPKEKYYIDELVSSLGVSVHV